MMDRGLDPTYLLKAVQGFQNQGIPVYAISVQVILNLTFDLINSDPCIERTPK